MTALGVKSVDSQYSSHLFRCHTHGKGSPGVRLTRTPNLPGVFTVALLLSGQPTEAADNPWSGAGWQRPEAVGYEAGYDVPGGDSYGWGNGGRSAPGVYQGQVPTWDYGGWAPPPREADFDDQYRQYRGVTWDHGVISNPGSPVPPGAYREPVPVSSVPAGPGWRTQMDYRSPYGGYVFRPLDQAEGAEAGRAPMWSPAGPVDGGLSPEVYPGFRFRGDANGPSGQWSSLPYAMGYRFRPLTDQERDGAGTGSEFGQGYLRGSEVPSMRGEMPPDGGVTYGFEPNPWRGR